MSIILPDGEQFQKHLKRRHLRGLLWQRFFFMAIAFGLLALLALVGNVVNEIVGLRAVSFQIEPATLAEGRDLASLSDVELETLVTTHLPLARERVIFRDVILGGAVTGSALVDTPLRDLLGGKPYPEALAGKTLRDLTQGELTSVIAATLSREGMLDLINTEIVGLQVAENWTLLESLFERPQIEADVAENHPDARLEFGSWLNAGFITQAMSSTPLDAGIRTALLGTIWLMLVTIAVAFPLGVGAAIYLEEYATGSRLNQLIEINIRNLAGVPSIIYGLLGLAVFVRALGEITGGRSILSAGLTMALLILPLIIINGQEALRAVPNSLRDASYGMGATRWQTIWRVVLPAAMPGILTGTILATSRAIGETAPLIVVGASTFILADPNGPLSKFTALPIQIYDWTKRPEAQFRDIAASTIVVLLALLLTLNAAAIILRQRFRRKLQG